MLCDDVLLHTGGILHFFMYHFFDGLCHVQLSHVLTSILGVLEAVFVGKRHDGKKGESF